MSEEEETGKGTKTILKAIMTGKFFQINVRQQTIDPGSSETISRINIKKNETKTKTMKQTNPTIFRTINFQAMDNQR